MYNNWIAGVLLFLLMSHTGFSQKIQYGFEGSKGYKSICQEASLGLYARFFKRIDVHFAWCEGKFNGNGITTGTKFILLKKKLQPYIGLGYTYGVGKPDKGTIYQEHKGVYKIWPNSLYCYDAGLIWDHKLYDDPESIFDGHFLIKLSCTYRTPVNAIKTEFIEGDYLAESEKALQQRLGKGFGGCLSLIVLLNTKKKS